MKSLNLTYLLLIQDLPQDDFRIKCCLSISILNCNSSNTLHVNNCIQSTCLCNLNNICIGHIVVCYNIIFIGIPHIAWKRQNKKNHILKKISKSPWNKEIKMINHLPKYELCSTWPCHWDRINCTCISKVCLPLEILLECVKSI